MNTQLFIETLDQLQTRQIEECAFEANGHTWKVLYNEDAEEFYLSYLYHKACPTRNGWQDEEWMPVLTICAALEDNAIAAIVKVAIKSVK